MAGYAASCAQLCVPSRGYAESVQDSRQEQYQNFLHEVEEARQSKIRFLPGMCPRAWRELLAEIRIYHIAGMETCIAETHTAKTRRQPSSVMRFLPGMSRIAEMHAMILGAMAKFVESNSSEPNSSSLCSP
eukprot:CAMPEP_0173104000 /NCGR_PEP_ID=MMETSP1102-20130122/38847_1 /TAXON_ID=49646 /ORGANISM="Geminigera sp., Strain Caron Lab Isolate" /LENGTH=130 /DNA_ID=CAMNT_0013999167 /DNA_START=111 /DNA_END=503 /DNA_ORIENTATION=-